MYRNLRPRRTSRSVQVCPAMARWWLIAPTARKPATLTFGCNISRQVSRNGLQQTPPPTVRPTLRRTEAQSSSAPSGTAAEFTSPRFRAELSVYSFPVEEIHVFHLTAAALFIGWAIGTKR